MEDVDIVIFLDFCNKFTRRWIDWISVSDWNGDHMKFWPVCVRSQKCNQIMQPALAMCVISALAQINFKSSEIVHKHRYYKTAHKNAPVSNRKNVEYLSGNWSRKQKHFPNYIYEWMKSWISIGSRKKMWWFSILHFVTHTQEISRNVKHFSALGCCFFVNEISYSLNRSVQGNSMH